MNFLFLGAPGSGKDTMAALVRERLGFHVWDAGTAIRYALEAEAPSPSVEKIKQELAKGFMAPPELSTGLYTEFMLNRSREDNILTVGFPRDMAQAHIFLQDLREDKFFIDGGIWFKVSDTQTLIERMSHRGTCSNTSECGVMYNTLTQPPRKEGICDFCGSALQRRSYDMDYERIINRLDVYERETLPVRSLLEEAGITFRIIDSSRTVEEVFPDIQKCLCTDVKRDRKNVRL